ncbi:hypothetical protein CGT95_15495 [Vibrio metoecus]|nr:hypothetical protein CGT95_15495 [Vibrio metoecus]
MILFILFSLSSKWDVILFVCEVKSKKMNFFSGFTNFQANKRLKRDCQRVAFPVPLSRSGSGCCV